MARCLRAAAVAGAIVAAAVCPAVAAAQVGAADARDIALDYVRDNAGALGTTRADVADLAVMSSYRSSHNRVTHVSVNQRHRGLEVFGAYATVNVAADGRVIFAGGSLVRGVTGGADSARLEPPGAVKAAANGLGLREPRDLRVLRRTARETVVSDGGISAEPIPARLGYQPTGDGLRLAWHVTIDDAADEHLWSATVDAASGKLLAKDDWTDHDNLDQLAERVGRADVAAAAFQPPFPVADGSSYRALGFPTESVNDGPRTLIQTPADSAASPFGWHDTNGAAGAEYTIARGNNAHAYLDQDDDEAPDFGGDANGGPGLDFDFPADLTQHAQAYRQAAVANLFYANNVVHDVLWRYGFDDASGNFQVNNYGRGGTGGDYVRAEAADGSGTNNANFNTPAADGNPPRMQMYLWPGNQLGRQNQVVVNGVAEFGAGWARFGPPATTGGTSGQIRLVSGNGRNASQACGRLDSLPAGAIAVVDAGGKCDFLAKVHNAQAAGASAVIVANDDAEAANPPILGGSFVEAPPTVPAVSVTQQDGAAIKAALPASGTVRKHPNHPGIRDGDLENGIIIHEYGHGVSNRLTGGLKTMNCLSGNEQAGEGWSDYLAITLLLNPALDDPNQPRGMGPYALFQPSRHGNGIRPRPYTRNMAIQPFTYDSIKTGAWLNGTSLALPHGLGHGWAAVLWDLDWDLIDKYGFNPDLYDAWDTGGNNRALQYVIDGLKLQGCGPGLVVASRAIIAAAEELSDGADTCTVWATFARRGLGFSAVQGTTDRNDNSEAFDTHPSCRRDFQSPATGPYGTLTTAGAGTAVPLKFTADGQTGLDVLAENSPFSRRVDCSTLKVPSSGQFITPRELPIPTEGGALTVDSTGLYTYPWKTLREWAGTCREVVVTRDDGRQHRAFFRFQ
jgi:extracellular elastinolytic metalloproteinase